MKNIQRSETIVFAFLLVVWTFGPTSVFSAPRILEKSYKQYIVYPYENNDILCEPYTVKQGDWLLRIMKSKGEISKKNFPLFLKIFKSLNPGVTDIDKILHGQTILIPLKQTPKKDSGTLKQALLEVPIIKMSDIHNKLLDFTKPHRVKPGENLCMIMDNAFLEENGTIKKEGRLLFTAFNPNIKNLDTIYVNTTLQLPQPEILSQPWLNDFLWQADNTLLAKEKNTINRGQMTNNGFINKSPPSIIPLYTDSGVIFAHDGNAPSPTLSISSLAPIQPFFFPNRKNGISPEISEAQLLPSNPKDAVRKILQTSNYPFLPEEQITVPVGNLSLKIKLGKIERPEGCDILVIFGDIYGSVLDELKKQGAEIVQLSPLDTVWDATGKIFTTMGITTTRNPSLLLAENNQVITLPGLYIEDPGQAIFISKDLLDFKTARFLEENQIKILYLYASRP